MARRRPTRTVVPRISGVARDQQSHANREAARLAGSAGRRTKVSSSAPRSTPSRPSSPPRSSGGYVVKRGDTLSAIAKRNGVSLAKIMELNPKFKTNSKYKGGNMIFSGTKVRLK